MQPDEQSQLYLMLGEIRGDLKSILASLSLQQAQFDRRKDEVDEQLQKVCNRVLSLERFQWKLAGLAAAIPTVISLLGLAISLKM